MDEKDIKRQLNNAINDALHLDCNALNDEELSELCQLLDKIRVGSMLYEWGIHESDIYLKRIEELELLLPKRCREASSLYELAMLVRAMIDLDKTDVCFFEENSSEFDSKIANAVMRGETNDFRIIHVLFLILKHGGVAAVHDTDESGNIKWEDGFDVVGCNDFLCSLLRSWGDTQQANGSWTALPLEEAFARMNMEITYDSWINDADGLDIFLSAYEYYGNKPCTTARELKAKWQTDLAKWQIDEGSFDQQFYLEQAAILLAMPNVSIVDRLRMQYIILFAGSEWYQ